MIDLHAHVLPGLDDGPATLESSLALARAAAADGVGTTGQPRTSVTTTRPTLPR